MLRIKFYFSVSAILFSCICFSQQLFVPRNIQAAYQKGTRSADGKPGKAYWQNTASYKLNVSFAPDTRLISGRVDITYVNNSPDTLKQIWFKLYPNLYKKGTPHLTKISPEDLTDGLIIDSMWTNDKLEDQRSFTIDGTNMIVNRQSLAHGQSIRFQIKYHYTLNKGSHNRTGQVDSNSAFIAYFFRVLLSMMILMDGTVFLIMVHRSFTMTSAALMHTLLFRKTFWFGLPVNCKMPRMF